MRDWKRIEKYLENLNQDVYEQPEDAGHTELAIRNTHWMKVPDCQSVLDVGCGTGYCQSIFHSRKMQYLGVALGNDVVIGLSLGNNVVEMDYNFLEFPDDSFDMVYARHSLEHSPFPIITLMEWHRVAREYLGLVMPNPDNYTFLGRNHYSVANPRQIAWWLRRAGWKILQVRLLSSEFWFVCKKLPIISYEGWAEVPLDNKIYEFERDLPTSGVLNIDMSLYGNV